MRGELVVDVPELPIASIRSILDAVDRALEALEAAAQRARGFGIGCELELCVAREALEDARAAMRGRLWREELRALMRASPALAAAVLEKARRRVEA